MTHKLWRIWHYTRILCIKKVHFRKIIWILLHLVQYLRRRKEIRKQKLFQKKYGAHFDITLNSTWEKKILIRCNPSIDKSYFFLWFVSNGKCIRVLYSPSSCCLLDLGFAFSLKGLSAWSKMIEKHTWSTMVMILQKLFTFFRQDVTWKIWFSIGKLYAIH